MANLDISEYTDYDAFAREWHAEDLTEGTLEAARDRGRINEDDTRLLWQLLGQLRENELLIQIPNWLAEEKVGFVEGSTPTMFVGRIERETENAILFADSASARPLMKLAHRIQHLEEDDTDDDRREWLDNRLHELREEFEERDDVTGLSDAWIPKSQLLHAVRRSS